MEWVTIGTDESNGYKRIHQAMSVGDNVILHIESLVTTNTNRGMTASISTTTTVIPNSKLVPASGGKYKIVGN